MPHEPRQYDHCIRCKVAMERPSFKRCQTETWYFDFTVCKDCKKELLAMENPCVTCMIDGETLKQLLQCKSNDLMLASILPAEATNG